MRVGVGDTVGVGDGVTVGVAVGCGDGVGVAVGCGVVEIPGRCPPVGKGASLFEEPQPDSSSARQRMQMIFFFMKFPPVKLFVPSVRRLLLENRLVDV